MLHSVTQELRALVLEEKGKLSLRELPVDEHLGDNDVRVKLHTVGICGSDVHYFTHGGSGDFTVRAPMILGHEASGTVIETGRQVTHLKEGDRVCMEPGIPTQNSRATQLGVYNLDPDVRFWATPPIHGILRASVVHPAAFTFRIPDHLSFAAAAAVEPLAVGVHAATKARIRPGDVALVLGAGPIGLLTTLAALSSGCSRVIVADVDPDKLAIASGLGAVTPVSVQSDNLDTVVSAETAGWGVDCVFECSGNEAAATNVFNQLCPGGRVVFIGSPGTTIRYDLPKAMIREASVMHVFRYAHVFSKCIAMLASGTIDISPLITKTFHFSESIEAFNLASKRPKGQVKMQITLAQ
jgi:D-xylulose reductase